MDVWNYIFGGTGLNAFTDLKNLQIHLAGMSGECFASPCCIGGIPKQNHGWQLGHDIQVLSLEAAGWLWIFLSGKLAGGRLHHNFWIFISVRVTQNELFSAFCYTWAIPVAQPIFHLRLRECSEAIAAVGRFWRCGPEGSLTAKDGQRFIVFPIVAWDFDIEAFCMNGKSWNFRRNSWYHPVSCSSLWLLCVADSWRLKCVAILFHLKRRRMQIERAFG